MSGVPGEFSLGLTSSCTEKTFKPELARAAFSQPELTQNITDDTDGHKIALTEVRGAKSFSPSYPLEYHLGLIISMPLLSAELLLCPPAFFP